MSAARAVVQRFAERAGVTINGSAPHDVQVHDDRFYGRVVAHGSLGLGEAYMDGWWDCARLDELFCRVLAVDGAPTGAGGWLDLLRVASARVLNRQSTSRARHVTRAHYDLSSCFFEKMLDRRMVYSCGYWRDATCLDEAQEQKLDLICRKLGLSANDRVLDIGCGWGGFVRFASERYGCRCVGLTLSGPQASYARAQCADLPVEIVEDDYRSLSRDAFGQFDKIVSIGMLEHVGPTNYRTFMTIVDQLLTTEGLCLIQTIGDNRSRMLADPWIDRYIFPNGVAPSVLQLGKAIERDLVMEDWHNFGPDYYRTLVAWHSNFVANRAHTVVQTGMTSEKFRRMWEYYLLSFASAFKVRHLQLWQVVLSKQDAQGAYQSLR